MEKPTSLQQIFKLADKLYQIDDCIANLLEHRIRLKKELNDLANAAQEPKPILTNSKMQN